MESLDERVTHGWVNNQIFGNKKNNYLCMKFQVSPMKPSIKERKWKGKGTFVYPIVGWRRLCHFEWLQAIVEFGGIEDYKEGTLEPRGAHLYQLAHSFVVQPHCSSRVCGEGKYLRSRLEGQPVGHYIRIKHDNL